MSIKEKIEEIYTKHTNYNEPEQAINQAESLKSLSTDLYTDAKRFIYELLQNADDSASDGQNVDVIIKLFDDTLVIAHTGKIFENDDIQGLCSINNGTKKSDTTKTGYKGIGFKSVFGQSNEVTIFTNNEYFKFDANHNIEWKAEWGKSQKVWETNNNNREFLYPWQIIPIYMNTFDNDIIQEFLSYGYWNVATIIKVSKLEEIKKAIEELSSNVNMFLFLKNINFIQFETNETILIEIERSEDKLILKKDNIVQVNWLVKTIELTVQDELKQILQLDANIPKKLKETDNIELTLAIKKTENGLEKLSDNETLLYAYLPTDEKRYKLPILVNTTFLTSANRESLHENSKWNQWLFKSISLELFNWIAELVQGEYSYQAYNLIPNKLNVNDDLSRDFNEGIDEAIESIPFILSKENELLKVNQALMDETKFSEKDFIGSEIIKKFMINKIGEGNQIVENPFIPNVSIPNINVNTFTWDDVPALFDFPNFKTEHTVEKNIQLIEYFKNSLEINELGIDKATLKGIAFILDHKNNLNYSTNIYFPTPDTTWNNPDSEISFLHQDIQSWLREKQLIREWLESLGVVEKTDISFLKKTVIPNASNHIKKENAIETIQNIYNLYKKEKIEEELAQLKELKLLTQKGTLIPASKCHFSATYSPRLDIENILDEDVFLSEKYLILDENNKSEIKRFFKFMGVHEGIEVIRYQGRKSISFLINKGFQDDYFKHFCSHSKWTMRINEYSNVTKVSFLKKTNQKFFKLFWQDIVTNIKATEIMNQIGGVWGKFNTTEMVENYMPWYIRNHNCIPTTQGKCEKAPNVFLNTKEIVEIGGAYLPIFEGDELNQEWSSFFKFKSELELDNYLEVLTNIMKDKTDKGKIKSHNENRVQLIYYTILTQFSSLKSEEIEKLKSWAKTAYLVDEENNLVLCSELQYYVDGNNDIFPNKYKFINLNEKNKTHQKIEIFLEFLGIKILRRDNFNIAFEGEERASGLKNKLEEIFPYLKNWIKNFGNEVNISDLEKRLDTLIINEASKLSLSDNGEFLKIVPVYLKENKLLVAINWRSNISMREVPKILCRYLDIEEYKDKLEFLLRADELEIREYFESEEIELPSITVPQQKEEILSKEEKTTLLITETEYDVICDDFRHMSESSKEKKEYILSLLPRSKERVLEHLIGLDEYDCDNVDSSALTVLSGITKYGKDIYIIPRPSDYGKVLIHYRSELDTLEYSDSELWYEDGESIPRKLTFGKVLRDARINKIPIIWDEKEKIIDIIQNPKNEDVAYIEIPPSPFDIAKIMASLANTNGGYFIMGYSEENGIVGIASDFNVAGLTQRAIAYSDYFKGFEFNEIMINEKNLITIKIEKSKDNIFINDKKYIRMGSLIKEELETNDKPLIITEGKTDWKHIKKALERFQKDELYTDLDIQFKEYEDMNMGDGELDRMVQTYCKVEQSKKYIFMFDRDNHKYVNTYAKKEFNNHNNNVYSFCIPKISDELNGICIEFYYKKEDLRTTDKDGKRIFLGDEFLDNGNSKCGKYVTPK